MQLNNINYYSDEANKEYLSVIMDVKPRLYKK